MNDSVVMVAAPLASLEPAFVVERLRSAAG
jgi:hypothetical protein